MKSVDNGNKNTIQLFEYDSIRYDECGITSQIIDSLEKLNTKLNKKDKLFTLYINELKVKQYVGLIRVDNRSIEILPKMYNEKSNKDEQIKNAQRNLLYLLHYCFDIKYDTNNIDLMQARKSNWFEILTSIYTKNLMELSKKGIHKQYIAVEENLPFFKGKWMIQQHFRTNTFHKHRFYVNYDEFSADIPLNQALRYATNRLKFQSQNANNKKTLYMLDQLLDEVTLLPDPMPVLNNIVFTRLNKAYQQVFNLAKLFIEKSVVETSSGSSSAFAFTFDMNILFERFIAKFIKNNRDEILPEYLKNCEIYVQHSGKVLAKSANNKEFTLKPDIIFKEGDITKLIIDTKYKRLDKSDKKCGVSQSDMYQMAAYASGYKCPNVILLYPHTADSNESVHDIYKICASDSTIQIATVDLRVDLNNPVNQSKLIDDLNEILKEEVRL